ncbi:unnamed protein product [Bursaphelenchus okinawaensis]|uniref:BHLH domain-containing protein n=1 Tax=Bursaphelenchus okinawaensis TaxID=465554 RepID=A0A811KVK7_9BILA|nr:unnamed protein product [Bursaphelenchus okinawaensis]CAG9112419.1 unnamed protein product [Bursaphelenchus okinawaensis]
MARHSSVSSSSSSESPRRSSAKPSPAIRKANKEKVKRQQAIDKLRVMVGQKEQSSQLEVVQGVIDYIAYLRAQLADDTENVQPPADDIIKSLTSRLNELLTN